MATVIVEFKNEDQVNGVAIGATRIQVQCDDGTFYNLEGGWFSRPDADKLAKALGGEVSEG